MTTKPSKPTLPTVPSKAKVDDTIDLKGMSYLVRLPDGTVVSGRGTYTPQQPGGHTIMIADEEHTVLVDKAAKK